jgi:tetratricopeptide (TPR) repeat protein/nucleoside phosphorylase
MGSGTPPADFLIVTALEEERDAVLKALGKTTKLDKEPEDIHTFYRGRVRSTRKDRSTYDVVVTCLLDMGPVNAAAQAAIVTKRWAPRNVLLVGIACGVKGEVEHGDILIATQVADYSLGKQKDGAREIRWNVSPCASSLLDSAINLTSRWQRKVRKERPGAGEPTKRKGVVASGGDVITDDDVIASYSDYWPKLVGLEMEAGGVATALHQTMGDPDFLMIKGVSDFGSDKHDPDVVPWRSYACHAAAAFARALIESGPFAKPPEDATKRDIGQRTAEAERRWIYLQDVEIDGVEILFLLKAPVGRKWFEQILEKTHFGFSREGPSFTLATALKLSPPPNTKEPSVRHETPICAFWEVYETDPTYWVQRISPDVREHSLVTGIEVSIPWSVFKVDAVRLRDLGRLDNIGVGLPPEAFSAGIAEVRIRFAGEQFTFDVAMSDHGLEFYHEMAATFHLVRDDGKGPPISFGMGFSGIQLLEIFRKQLLPADEEAERKKPIFGGMGGSVGKHIRFYPGMPEGFSKSSEADEYTIRLTVRNTDELKARVAELEAKVADGSDDPMIHGELAARYSHEGRFLDAIKCLEGAIAKGLGTALLHGLLADSLLHLGRAEEAFLHFCKVTEMEPGSAAAERGKGAAKDAMGDDAAAVEHFQKAVELEPAAAKNHANLGLALARQQRYADAISAYERAVELDPNDSGSFLYLGIVRQAEGRADEARESFEAACRLAPDDAEPHELLGSLLAKADLHDEALAHFQHAVEIDPTERRHALLGASLAGVNRWGDAEAAFRDALRLEPENAESLANLAVVLANQQRFDEGIPLVVRAIEISPDEPKLKQLLTELRRAKDQLEEP